MEIKISLSHIRCIIITFNIFLLTKTVCYQMRFCCFVFCGIEGKQNKYKIIYITLVFFLSFLIISQPRNLSYSLRSLIQYWRNTWTAEVVIINKQKKSRRWYQQRMKSTYFQNIQTQTCAKTLLGVSLIIEKTYNRNKCVTSLSRVSVVIYWNQVMFHSLILQTLLHVH